MKSLILGIIFVFSISTAAFSQTPAPLTEKDYIRVDADLKAGFGYPYYLYVPPEVRNDPDKKKIHTILVLPNNTGKLNDDFAVHESDVKRRMSSINAIAPVLKVAVLMPVFPRPASDWQTYTHALDRDSMVTTKSELRRFDLQLIAMIDNARAKFNQDGLNFDKRVLMSGYSASGMFANRFTFLHPKRVKAATIGSPGGWPMAPVEKFNGKSLRYPIGVADLKIVSGQKLDLKSLRKVPLFVFLGDKDTNDSVPFGDSYEQVDRELIDPLLGSTPVLRWKVSEQMYREAGLNAEFKLYPDVPHTITPLMRDDIKTFLLKHK